MTDDEYGIAGPPTVLGFCDECGHQIEEGESWHSRADSAPIYGRIGAPSYIITGRTQPRITWTCAACRTEADATVSAKLAF